VPTARITKVKLLLLGNIDEDTGEPIKDYVVAVTCGMAPGTLTQYSRGRRQFLQKHLLALADYFHVDPNDLHGWVEVTFPESGVTVG
jgi:hypothetical protein